MSKEKLFDLMDVLKDSPVVYDADCPADVLELLKNIINLFSEVDE